MVKSFMNAFCGGVGRTLGKILVYLAIGLIFFFIYDEAHAAAVYGGTGSTCDSTKYNIFKQDDTRVTGTTSTSYNYNWKEITFYGTENLQANTYYDLVITFRSNISNSILNTFIDGSIIGNAGIDGIHLHSTSSLCGSINGEIPLTYYSISGAKLTVRFLTGPTMVDYWWFSTNFYFNGSNGINSAVFTQVDLSGSSGIIENNNDNTNTIINNNNQNTQDVIDNQNDNTQDIIDSQNQNAQDVIDNQNQNTQDVINNNNNANYTCLNGTMKAYPLVQGAYIARANGSYNNHNDFNVSVKYKIKPNKSYGFDFKVFTNLQGGYLCWYDSSDTVISCSKYSDISGYGSGVMTVTSPQNSEFVSFTYRKGSNATIIGEVCVNNNVITAYSIDDLTNVISDNSDGDTNIFSTWWDNFDPLSNPLGNVVTLPVTLAQKIVGFNNSSCQSINLGNLLGHNLTLTCFTLTSVLPDNASSLINTIDIIMSVSLLVVIIKNTYETIANLISLGGENKIKSHFRLPTPLEFLSSVLNGNGYAEYIEWR